MAIVAGDVWSPDAVAQLAFDQAEEKIALLKSGYVTNVTNDVGKDASGNNIAFPYVSDEKMVGKIQNNARTGTAVTPDTLVLKNENVPIASGIFSVKYDEKQIRSFGATGNANLYMSNQYLKYAVEKIETTLMTTAGTTTLETDISEVGDGLISLKALDLAITEGWEGQQEDGAQPLVIMHPNVAFNLKNSAQVVNARANAGHENTFGSRILNVGEYKMMSSRLTPVASTIYTTFILLPGAVELYFDTLTSGNKTAGLPGTSSYQTDWYFDYATHLTRVNPRKVLKLKTLASLTI